jgi:hypothetical protein
MNRALLSAVLSTLLIASLIFTGCSGKYEKGSSVIKWGTRIILNTDLSEFPDKLNYYSTIKPQVTAEWVQGIGDKLGILDEAEFTPSGNRFIMSEGDEWLEVNGNNGAVTVSGIHISHETDAELSSSENAVLIATEFVKYLGLWDDNIEVGEVVLRYEDIPIKQEWGVYFNQDVGGYPMVGGAKLFHVIVNLYGTVLSAGCYNPELQYAGEVDCITVREAYDLFLEGEALNFIFSPGVKTVEVNDVYIGYYVETQTELQEYFMPVYVFEGELFTSGGNTEVFQACVLAKS